MILNLLFWVNISGLRDYSWTARVTTGNLVKLLPIPSMSMKLASESWVKMVYMHSHAVCVCVCGGDGYVIEN